MRGANARGVRNHNPGNLRLSSDPWQGLAKEQRDTAFFQFTEARWGIRAIARTLIAYRDRHKLATVTGIINRWAPPIENNTKGYILFVAKRLGVDPDAQIDVTDYATAKAIVDAIIAMECDGYRYPDGVVDAGLRLAGIEPPARGVVETGTVRGAATVAGAAAGAGVAVEIAQAATPYAAVLQTLAQNSPWLIVFSIVAALAYVVWSRSRRRNREGI